MVDKVLSFSHCYYIILCMHPKHLIKLEMTDFLSVMPDGVIPQGAKASPSKFGKALKVPRESDPLGFRSRDISEG